MDPPLADVARLTGNASVEKAAEPALQREPLEQLESCVDLASAMQPYGAFNLCHVQEASTPCSIVKQVVANNVPELVSEPSARGSSESHLVLPMPRFF